MANLKLPARFDARLRENQFLEGMIKTAVAEFGDIYADNKLYFFEEYTDHGLSHLEKVLAASENLISKDSFENILTSHDIGCYIMSVLLHDIGMHLSLDGFNCLLSGDYDIVRVKELDKKTWAELWTDFLNEARRYGGKTLKAIFGNENFVVRVPPLKNREEMNGYDKKMVGEFIRRHHARIAHEIALDGFPGIRQKLLFIPAMDRKTRDIVGLIARSHGTDLRRCTDYIESIYGKNNRRYPNNIHAAYLMTILRIADYIQIDSTRTSRTLLKIKTFSSPISAMEHNAHLAIDTVNDQYQDDPEKILVTADPRDSKMYLKIKRLISDIQHELDLSWAVLGELYGRFYKKPELRYRRITSNLTEDFFISRLEYVPDQFSFKANDEITKLLIAPLYGDDPTYGVRELLQNAVDACRERQQIELKNGNPDYKPSVKVEISDTPESLFVIADNGIGMDIDVIKNYFLNAGASYRKSLAWQKEYLNEQGRSIVQRNGRFGIGVLAAFLIGTEIMVETRKAASDIGYRFTADLDTEQINVIKDEAIDVGTTIRIRLTSKTLETFSRDGKVSAYWTQWYTLRSPKVEYIDLGEKIYSFADRVPDEDEALPPGWNEFIPEGFNKVMWRFPELPGNYHHRVICNGIVIPDTTDIDRSILDIGLFMNKPQISIFDYDANLPLTLNRRGFSGAIPFSDQLKESLYKDYIAYILGLEGIGHVLDKTIHLERGQLYYQGTDRLEFRTEFPVFGFNIYSPYEVTGGRLGQLLEMLLMSKKGYVINYNYFLQKLGKINAILVQSDGVLGSRSGFELDILDRFLLHTHHSIDSINEYLAAMEARTKDPATGIIRPYNARIFLKKEKFDFLFDPEKKRTALPLRQKYKPAYHKHGWTCIELGSPEERSLITDSWLKKYGDTVNFVREYDIECPYEGDPIMNRLLARYIGDDVIIPFSLEERRKKYPLAFKELAVNISYHHRSPLDGMISAVQHKQE